MPRTDKIIKEIRAELNRAITKFPRWPTDPLHASGIIAEESGELFKAVLQQVYEPHKNDAGNLRAEAIQTATMCIRFLVSLDNGDYDWRPGFQHLQDDE